jgi:hypothetical protein
MEIRIPFGKPEGWKLAEATIGGRYGWKYWAKFSAAPSELLGCNLPGKANL